MEKIEMNARSWIKSYGIFLVMLGIFVGYGCYYVNLAARNLVFMDYWRVIVGMINELQHTDNLLTFLWNDSLGQRNVFTKLLVLINYRFTHLNCLWESYAGILIIAVSGCVLYSTWKKTLAEDKAAWKVQICFVPILFMLYNFNQWEIMSLQFSFSFFVRLLVFISIWKLLDTRIKSNEWDLKKMVPCIILLFTAICLLGQLYWLALLASVFSVLFFALFLERGEWKQKAIFFIVLLILCLIFVGIYFVGLPMENSGLGGTNPFKILFSEDLIKAALFMLVAIFIPQTEISNLSHWNIYHIGMLLACVIVFAVFIYFKKKMYKNTYLPIFMILYGCFSIVTIGIGRIGPFGFTYLAASRYTCETSLIYVGCFWILLSALFESKVVTKVAISLIVLTLTFELFHSNRVEFSIAPYRGFGKDSLISFLLEVDEDDLEERTLDMGMIDAFQSSPDLVYEGIHLLKENNLNVYYSEEREKNE